ncbi:ribose-phosphate diphosphokinase [Mycobacteroides abscessus subsp. bolletii]|uniref:phosphoribosyltransferase n=1 Tax=Mycobacteroides abscessus TaxID=36809 RepID=UPI0009C607E4|nr:phosphoribosyltransferase family protein [Mycobacteroides abscessus]SKH61667.1 ribose-phosphate diphosphokinase [Mycobacteroides abscessus subsp. bolletii]SLF55481.1 ribose-phosphate diphosphokinase [Mycobacteroides abscessus subsp. bolletii]
MFSDRQDAGRVLVGMLAPRKLRNIVVLALPRGGIPVGREIATALNAPLTVLVVRKLGVPGHEEYAMGAIASGGEVVLDDDIVRSMGVTPIQLEEVTDRERRELARRERIYLAHRGVEIGDKTVILVDDGIATGATMRVALLTVKRASPARVVAAVPVAPLSAVGRFGSLVDDFVVATCPSRFQAVGDAYQDFHQISDREVRELLSAPVIR